MWTTHILLPNKNTTLNFSIQYTVYFFSVYCFLPFSTLFFHIRYTEFFSGATPQNRMSLFSKSHVRFLKNAHAFWEKGMCDSNCFRLRKDILQGTTSTYLSYIMICIYPLALARQNTW